MKCLYLDSSVLVSMALADERRSRVSFERIQEMDSVGTSEIAIVECQSGLSAQLSSKPQLLVAAEQNLNQLLARITTFSVESLVLGHARSLVKRYRESLGLRTLDAIHLATANLIRDVIHSQKGARLEYLTSDQKQHAAFTAEGHLGEYLS